MNRISGKFEFGETASGASMRGTDLGAFVVIPFLAAGPGWQKYVYQTAYDQARAAATAPVRRGLWEFSVN